MTSFLLGGCAVAALSTMDDPMTIFKSNRANLAEKNYAAADYLIGRGSGFIKREHVIKATPLLNVQEPRLITALGKKIPEQIGERFIQLGYETDISAVATDIMPPFRVTPEPISSRPDFILTGTYLLRTSTILVKLQLQDALTGQERASFDYTLPRSGELRRFSKPKPDAFITSPR